MTIAAAATVRVVLVPPVPVLQPVDHVRVTDVDHLPNDVLKWRYLEMES